MKYKHKLVTWSDVKGAAKVKKMKDLKVNFKGTGKQFWSTDVDKKKSK